MITTLEPRSKGHAAMMQIDDAMMGREVAITSAEMEYPPFRWADEEAPGRLGKAAALVLGHRVFPVTAHPGTWVVHGKTQRYDIAERCSCKQGQHASSKYCYHVVAVELYRRLQARLGLPVPPWAGGLTFLGKPIDANVPLILTDDATGLDDESPPMATDLSTTGGNALAPVHCQTCGDVGSDDHAIVTLTCGHTLCAFCAKDGCTQCVDAEPVAEAPEPVIIPEEPAMAVQTPTMTETSTPSKAPTGTMELSLPPSRSIQAIVSDLSRALPAGCVAEKSLKGNKISFLHWQTVARVLDTYAPGWSGAVVEIAQVGKACAITYRLTIPCAEGTVSREATGQEEEEVDGYGDSTSNAEAMAFKRAAAKFGLGAWLYTKDGTDDALSKHLKAERALLLDELGKALDTRQMPRKPFIAWLRDKTGATKNQDIPVVALKALVAQLGQEAL